MAGTHCRSRSQAGSLSPAAELVLFLMFFPNIATHHLVTKFTKTDIATHLLVTKFTKTDIGTQYPPSLNSLKQEGLDIELLYSAPPRTKIYKKGYEKWGTYSRYFKFYLRNKVW